MAVTIRLMRFGKRHFPTYRIVAIDKRKKRDGSYIEKVGYYYPMNENDRLSINEERFNYWKGIGAEISEGVRKLTKATMAPKVAKKAKPAAKAESAEKAPAAAKKAPAKKAAAKK